MVDDLDKKQLTHDRLGPEFETIMNHYDIQRRLEVLIDDFLSDLDLNGLQVLDAGCGTGRGTGRLIDYGAKVTALDFGFRLLDYTKNKYNCETVNASVLTLPFASNTFDVVYSSEVIEHTPDPILAVIEMIRVLKPKGRLVLSTPNKLWQIPVRIASSLKLRPYNGLENFVSPVHLSDFLLKYGHIISHKGLHLIPFQISFLQNLSCYLDRYGENLLPIMINQCINFQKY